MSTHEERITALERDFTSFRKETAANIQELKENSTILLGLIYEERRDIRGITQRLDRLEVGFNEHTALLHQILARLPEPR